MLTNVWQSMSGFLEFCSQLLRSPYFMHSLTGLACIFFSINHNFLRSQSSQRMFIGVWELMNWHWILNTTFGTHQKLNYVGGGEFGYHYQRVTKSIKSNSIGLQKLWQMNFNSVSRLFVILEVSQLSRRTLTSSFPLLHK